MPTYIRLTDYKSSDEKEQGFFDSKNRYEAKQEDFEKIPGSPIAYWVSSKILKIFQNNDSLGNIFEAKQGMVTSDNDRFLRIWTEISFKKFGLNIKSVDDAKASLLKWFPYNKGGEYRRWYGNSEHIVNYENNANELKEFQSTLNQGWNVRLKSREYYFRDTISWTDLTTVGLSARQYSNGSIFDVSGHSSFFGNGEEMLGVLGLLNIKLSTDLSRLINPTLHFQVSDFRKMPYLSKFINSEKVHQLTQQNIDISKEEWDSRETSWDFAQNEILRILNDEFLVLNENPTLEMVYNRYCEYWKEKFFTLHVNEEELNRLFIDIYELQDELTPDVALEDITILKKEAKVCIPTQERGNEGVGRGALVFQADEIMKQFISYGVGVMFGRYSLDKEGLVIANLGSETLVSQMIDETKVSFPIDDDNIIPVLEDDYFKDDISSRFVQFVKTTFGEENLSQNIRFIESSLGTTLRKYFVKGFYEDHIKRYKKRPIYWMVASTKKGFMNLIYMHRYEADTFARVRNSYLTEYIAKLEAHKETLTLTTTSDTASNADKKSADKQMKQIEQKLKELIEFDRDKMMHFAQTTTQIDLDDGVKVNYCKFKDILYPIKGLCK